MSWIRTDYTFGPGVYTADGMVNSQFPGLVLNPMETGGEVQAVREINGDLWLLTNCDLDKTSGKLVQSDSTKSSYGLQFCGESNSGYVYRYYTTPGSPPWVPYPVNWTAKLWSVTSNALMFPNTTYGDSGAIVYGNIIAASGNIIAQSGQVMGTSNNNTLTYVPPVYDHYGNAVLSSVHIVLDSVTASSTGTLTVTMYNAAQPNNVGYSVIVWDVTTGAVVTPVTRVAANSFSFSATNTHIYNYMVVAP
jgi:hypothetical protein